ncbi:serine O-acetyltransferase EpsC [Persicitalea sp.]|uniref:serine O-acetyltransferase EpsC n=1 Tax=Persicitalea sp. TaxID=3100273 RepID=UPI0035949485
MNLPQQQAFFSRIAEQNAQYRFRLPSKQEAGKFLHRLLDFLFPISQDCREFDNERDTNAVFGEIKQQLECLLRPLGEKLNTDSATATNEFFKKLPGVFELLLLDAREITENDPASVGIEEVIAVYPGFMAIATYRIAHLLEECDVPLLPRMLTEYAHGLTGIDIHPKAVIGHSFFIDHGTGVVIGETTEIGNHVMIYQGVTLGATHVAKSLASQKRHPTIEDRVVIYANATILGGRTVIGEGTVVGGNAWITQSVPSYSQVFNQSEVEIRTQPA